MSGTPQRRVRVDEATQETLFDFAPAWQSEWWGMPSFEQGDARPAYRITVNFLTREDLLEFGNRIGVNVTTKTDSAWFPPPNEERPNQWEYTDES